MKYFNAVFNMLSFEWMTKQEQKFRRFFLLELFLKVTSPIVNNWTNFDYVSGKFLELMWELYLILRDDLETIKAL